MPPGDMMHGATLSETAGRIRANIERVIVGKGDVIELCLVALLCQGHVLIEDVPGIGKTTLAKAIARSTRLHLPPHPVHARPAALRRHRHLLLQPEDAGVRVSRPGRC